MSNHIRSNLNVSLFKKVFRKRSLNNYSLHKKKKKKKKKINDSKRDLDMKDPTEEQSYIAP